MLIVPIEKNLSLKHPPIILFFIVLLNVCVFFFYQSGEDTTIQQSLKTYQEEQFFDDEWEYVQEHLTNTDQIALLDEFELLNTDQRYDELHFRTLMLPDFFSFYRPFAISISNDGEFDQKIILREEIDQAISSLSFIRLGLIPREHSAITFVTYQFLHADFLHLLGNMFFLILFGFAVEAAIGHIRFLTFYVLSGITGGLLYMVVDLEGVQPLVGASGAISGVMAMYLAIFRLQKIEFFYWLFIFIGYIRAPALAILPLYIGKEIYAFYNDTGSNVAFMAHAGGLIGGSIFIGLSYIFTPDIFNREYIEEDQTQDPKQEELSLLYKSVERYNFSTALKLSDNILKEYGDDTDIAFLRYRLLSIDKNKEFRQSALELLSQTSIYKHHLQKIESIWKENPDIQQDLNDDTLNQLGVALCELDDPTTAATIFNILKSQNSQHQLLGIYARKLSMRYQALKNNIKKEEYERFADSLLENRT